VGNATVLVVDPVGDVFDRVSSVGLGLGLRHLAAPVTGALRVEADLAVLAGYDRIDWLAASYLASEVPTVVVAADGGGGQHALTALAFGLMGYLDRAVPAAALKRALLGVLQGEPAYRRQVLGQWMRSRRLLATDALSRLTQRQRQILTLVAQGAADKQIAAVLGISSATVQKHVANILERLGAPNRAAAVARLSRWRSWQASSAFELGSPTGGVSAANEVGKGRSR
jgi:DNA-binding NarL/FixJ family response regulator